MQRLALGVLAGFALLVAGPARAAEVPVAVAANFTEPAKEIAAAFKAATGNTAVLSFGSSGQFYAQITHGAPYQVFLSADVDRADHVIQAGYAAKGSRFVYAVGQLVLFSKTPGLVDPDGRVLKRVGAFQRIAIADPGAAPYGEAAVQTMKALGVYDALKAKIVQGASITQAYQFVETGAAELGFVALSEVVHVAGGSRWLVPDSLHAPIEQGAVLLVTGERNPAAQAFIDYLKGAKAKAIIRSFGYKAP